MIPLKNVGVLRALIPLYVGFGLLTGLLLGIFVFVARQTDDYNDFRLGVNSRQLMGRLLSGLQDAETGQRGYLLTGDRSYLKPYTEAVGLIHGDFKALADNLDGEPTDQSELSALRALADQKLTELRTTIDLYDAGRASDAISIVKNGSGKAIMDQIRVSVANLVADYQRHVDTRFEEAARAGNWLRSGAVASFAVMAALAFLSISTLKNKITDLVASNAKVGEANDRLLEEARQREAISEQLRQSQKMEAVGQLTGGIAHDFNNMLAIVMGGLNLAMRRARRGEPGVERYLESALDGAERAATLTHRLLAFSRQQPLSPVSIDPNKMVGGMSELLRRALTESVQLETVLAGGLWRTHADPSQLENAILNLAVNARDAMPEGGKLTVETSNAFLDEEYAARHVGIPVGQYVLIAVTDTGVGMSPELVEKVFDPFFTTKPVGVGTGLGLSQVYGFVKQSNGHVKVYSEPGHGTTVKIYLPRFTGEEKSADATNHSPLGFPVARPGETILVAEDDDRVREMTVEALKDFVYAVLEANGAAEALRLIDAGGRLDLLFTDIVMPDINGRKLAIEAERRRPGLKVLYTTGFTRNAVVHNGTLDRGVDLITKPYQNQQLVRKIREVIDR